MEQSRDLLFDRGELPSWNRSLGYLRRPEDPSISRTCVQPRFSDSGLLANVIDQGQPKNGRVEPEATEIKPQR